MTKILVWACFSFKIIDKIRFKGEAPYVDFNFKILTKVQFQNCWWNFIFNNDLILQSYSTLTYQPIGLSKLLHHSSIKWVRDRLAWQWLYFGPIEKEKLSICWTYEYLLMFTVIWDFSSVWQANHNFELKGCQKWCSHEKVSWFVHQSQIYILMFVIFTLRFEWDIYQLMFSSMTIYR